MYAIVEIGGFQYRVEQDKFLYVPLLGVAEGSIISIDKVLLLNRDGSVMLGAPYLDGVSVSAKVLSQRVRGDKVIVFKKKRRKGYRVKRGHRQDFSKIFIQKIG